MGTISDMPAIKRVGGRPLLASFLLFLPISLLFTVTGLQYRVATAQPTGADPMVQQDKQIRQQTLLEESIGERVKKLGGQVKTIRLPPERIEEIQLAGPEVTDEALAALGLERLESLRSLTLKNTAVTDKGLAAVTKLRELRYLILNRSQVTDKGLTHLVWMDNLHTVQLFEVPVTDVGLAILSVRETLWRLEVIHCGKVTDEGVDRFRRTRPKCELYCCDAAGRVK